MGWVERARLWNETYGERLHLEPELIRFSFEKTATQDPVVVTTPSFELLCKLEKNLLRLHLPIPLKKLGANEFAPLRDKARELGALKIIFGGGDRHLFPGVPLSGDLRQWLQWIPPKGEAVVDLEGSLALLVKESEKIQLRGILRPPKNSEEQKTLLDFVAREFPGRWTREISNDFLAGLQKYYFGYFIEGELTGYVRLYGWNREYKGPGNNFIRGQEKLGGLGPIGVAAALRGAGFGAQILKASWNVLLAHGCSRVRVDWTTEIGFYEKKGLTIVQEYQPAQIQI